MISLLAPLVLLLLFLKVRGRRVAAREPWLLLPGLVFLVLALSFDLGPSATGKPLGGGGDVLVCLDLSRSMLARDLPPDRLARAREEILALLEEGGQDRFALVGFAGVPRLLVPLTRDRKSFAQVLQEAGPLFLPKGGTDLGAALRASLDALVTSERRRSPCILLFSDGEDHGGEGSRLAGECRKRGIPVFCVGMGTALGGKIPILSADGREHFLEDSEGREVLTRLRPQGLQRIAAESGGTYFEGWPGGATRDLYREAVLGARRKIRGSPVLGQVLALLGLLLWALFVAGTPGGRA